MPAGGRFIIDGCGGIGYCARVAVTKQFAYLGACSTQAQTEWVTLMLEAHARSLMADTNSHLYGAAYVAALNGESPAKRARKTETDTQQGSDNIEPQGGAPEPPQPLADGTDGGSTPHAGGKVAGGTGADLPGSLQQMLAQARASLGAS